MITNKIFFDLIIIFLLYSFSGLGKIAPKHKLYGFELINLFDFILSCSSFAAFSIFVFSFLFKKLLLQL